MVMSVLWMGSKLKQEGENLYRKDYIWVQVVTWEILNSNGNKRINFEDWQAVEEI